MSGEDIFRYLSDTHGAYTLETIAFNMAVTTLLGLFIFFVYKKTFNGVMYSLSYNLTMVIITMTTAMIIMLIGSNLAISLGMVGALSIVRFRSAIKEPRDLAFLFWSIGVGLSAGTGAFLIAVIGSLFIAVLLFIFGKVVYSDCLYLLVLRGKNLQPKAAEDLFKDYGIKFKLRMQNAGNNSVEITYEIYLKKQKAYVVLEEFKADKKIGADEVNLVSFSGEVTG